MIRLTIGNRQCLPKDSDIWKSYAIMEYVYDDCPYGFKKYYMEPAKLHLMYYDLFETTQVVFDPFEISYYNPETD